MLQISPHPTDPLLNPSLIWHSFEFREPVTVLTDLIVAAVAFYAFYQLNRQKHGPSRDTKMYQLFFFILALSMISGGILGHGLQAYLSPSWKKVSWIFGAASFLCLTIGFVNHLLNRWSAKHISVIKYILIAKFTGFVFYILVPDSQSFGIVTLNSTIDMIGIILPINLLVLVKNKVIGAQMVLLSLLFAAAAGMVFSQKLTFGVWFNHLDISHILMAIFVYIIYLGTRALGHSETVL